MYIYSAYVYIYIHIQCICMYLYIYTGHMYISINMQGIYIYLYKYTGHMYIYIQGIYLYIYMCSLFCAVIYRVLDPTCYTTSLTKCPVNVHQVEVGSLSHLHICHKVLGTSQVVMVPDF